MNPYMSGGVGGNYLIESVYYVTPQADLGKSGLFECNRKYFEH